MDESKSEKPSQLSESKSSASKPNRKPGRPKGSKNLDLPTVVELPTACPMCESTEAYVRQTVRQRDTHGKFLGQKYNRVTWRRMQCANCEQVFMRRTYRLI